MVIRSPQNRRLKDIRRLRRSKGPHTLLEGPHLVREALDAGLRPDPVLVTPDFLHRPEGRALRQRLSVDPLEVDRRLLDRLCDADSPRGILAVLHLPRGGVTTLPRVEGGIYLWLEGVQDPLNLGSLSRVAEAAGVVALALSPGTVHPNHPRALRGSAGSLLRLPVAEQVGLDDLADHLEDLRPSLVALAPRGGQDLWRAPLEGTLVLALGAEGPGLSPASRSRTGAVVTIPVAPPVESLNLAVAAAVVLFEIRRRRRA